MNPAAGGPPPAGYAPGTRAPAPAPVQRAYQLPVPTGQAPPPPAAPQQRQLDANQVNYLSSHGFSSGLIRALSMAINVYPLRIMIIDNSLSMRTRDSHRLVERPGGESRKNFGMVDCTRWEEITLDCGPFHARTAGVVGFPLRLVMLNDPGHYGGPRFCSVGEKGPAAAPMEVQEAINMMTRSSPTGATPLTQDVNNIYNLIAPMAPTLQREGRRVAVILATDGLPSDSMGNEGHIILQQFVESLKRLETLPVSVVVRLATDDEAVVDFYNSIDKQLGNLPYDVLDDFYGEALEVYLRNPWLTYALPLHRFREFGVYVPAIDHLDEEALSLKELHDFCSGLFAAGQGHPPVVLPDPAANWPGFINTLSALQAREQMHFNPVTKRVSPWIDLNLLNMLYGRGHQLPGQVPVQQQQSYQQVGPMRSSGMGLPAQQQQPQAFSASQGYHSQPQMQEGLRSSGGYGQFQQQFGQPAQPCQPQQAQQPAQPSMQRPPQQQAAPPASHAPPPPPSAKPQATYAQAADKSGPNEGGNSALKRGILTQWALGPPNFQALRPVHELLCSVQDTFPPAHGVPPHEYFGKWKPFAPSAFASGDAAVLKRAMRKMKFFLHPDKLPRDLTADQSFLCSTLWHVLNDAMDAALPS